MFAFGKKSINILTNVNDEQNTSNFFFFSEYNLAHLARIPGGEYATKRIYL